MSVLVPAYNEEVTCVDSIRSLLRLDYPSYEIVICNDGSKDRTVEILRESGIPAIQGNYEESLATSAEDCHCGYTDPRDNAFAQISYDYTREKTAATHKAWMATLPSPCLAMNMPGAAASHSWPSGMTSAWSFHFQMRRPSPIWSNQRSWAFCRNVVRGSSKKGNAHHVGP